MQTITQKIISILGICLVSQGSVMAHTAGGPIDAAGNNAHATDYGYISCYDDGNGPAEYLLVQIEDGSPPVPGLLVSLQVFKDNKMINVTDPISGDGVPSVPVKLQGKNGTYNIAINKTAAGKRDFSVTYHCETSGDIHTGTDIGVFQLQ